ncbi:MAG TPA: tRNA dihydrouridine synthase DusB [Acidimicrobiales bacterium]|nr:tRNA dihydrouridine synthase DusB [Acidimicrobiales bacterium]
MALKIGPLAVDPPVVLAPMAGVTNPAFRQLCRGYGGGLYVSEMITARAVTERNDKTMRMAARAAGEDVHSVQLYGVDPAVMHTAVRIVVEELGADHIDLNFGCPAPKVTRKGGGAALPAHPVLYRRVVSAAVRAAGTVPVTVKMRSGLNEATETATEAALIAEAEGAAAVALHARTAEQRYSGHARWDDIARLKEAVRTVPVLGNGDIWEASDALEMQRRTGCDGVVVGRGCLGRPWLFEDLQAAYRHGPGAPRREPALGQVGEVMRHHAALLVEHLGPAGVRDFRKHTGWYLTGFPVGPVVRRNLSQVSTLDELDHLLSALDPHLTRPPETARLPRGHTDGPRPVALPDGWLDDRDDPTPPAGADVLVSGG